MSADNAISFYGELAKDEGLQQKLDSANVARSELGKKASELGKEKGLDFTPAEFEAVHALMKQSEQVGDEIPDEELEAVAGGGKSGWWPCWKHTKCYTCGTRFKEPGKEAGFPGQVDTMALKLGSH